VQCVQSRVDVYLSGLIMFHVGCAGQEGGLQEGVGPFKGVGVEAGVELLPALHPPTVCVVCRRRLMCQLRWW
jgi:hypothetical protein